MERIIQSHGEHLKPVLLYRDDIEQIVEVMQELSPNVELSTDHYKFNDLKEWAELKRDYFTNMQVLTRTPFVSLELKESEIWLYIAEDTAQSRGAFEKIKRILADHTRPSVKVMNTWMPPMAGAICLQPITFLTLHRSWASLTIAAIIVLGCAWWFWWAVHTRFHKYSIVIPKYRTDAPSFWKRNSDKIVLGIITAALGSLLTLLIKSLVAKGP
jgi:hypothetical protein